MMDFEQYEGKKIVILGFGREGRSTYDYLVKHLKSCVLQIMDKNVSYVKENLISPPAYVQICREEEYLRFDRDVDYVFKSPGIPLMNIEDKLPIEKITSQSNEFIKGFRDRVFGITGTKGKSTTSTFLTELLRASGIKATVVGNIGKPAFDYIDEDDGSGVFVYELSSHQLETVKVSPFCAIILNIFEEHLDHYHSYDHYAESKMNIGRYQLDGDSIIYSALDDEISKRMNGFKGNRYEIGNDGFAAINVYEDGIAIKALGEEMTLSIEEDRKIHGKHNVVNMAVAYVATLCVGYDVKEAFLRLNKTFEGLPHRLKEVAKVNGVTYYNDSISTIPQTTIAAVDAIDNVGTLIIGGMDRGVDYSVLVAFLNKHSHIKCVLLPTTGHKLFEGLNSKERLYKVNNLDEAVRMASQVTHEGESCVLSPASPSYGYFKNFEERGTCFETYVKKLTKKVEDI